MKVLIETLWNVNMIGQMSIFDMENGFNRNIVECKSIMHVDVFAIAEVLIETLWNVNTCIWVCI